MLIDWDLLFDVVIKVLVFGGGVVGYGMLFGFEEV